MEIGKIQINTIGEKEQQGGATGGGDSNIEYLDLRNVTTHNGLPLSEYLVNLGYACKFLDPNTRLVTIMYSGVFLGVYTQIIATIEMYEVEINFNEIYVGDSAAGMHTIKDALFELGITQEQLDAIPRITKEQFYTL